MRFKIGNGVQGQGFGLGLGVGEIWGKSFGLELKGWGTKSMIMGFNFENYMKCYKYHSVGSILKAGLKVQGSKCLKDKCFFHSKCYPCIKISA